MLGCILYELCTLRRPFEGESLNQVVHKIVNTPYSPLKDSSFDPLFEKLLSILLNKNAFMRASAEEILQIKEISKRVPRVKKMTESA